MGFLLPRSLPFAHPQSASPADGRYCGLFIHRMRGSRLQILCLKQPRMGFEPTTYRLRSDCSTVELPRHNTQKIYRNHPLFQRASSLKLRPTTYPPKLGGVALPLSYLGTILKRSTGITLYSNGRPA